MSHQHENWPCRREMKSSHDPTSKPILFTDQLRAASRGIHANNTAVVASKLLVVLTHRQQYGRAISCFAHIHCALQLHLAAMCASSPELQLLGPVLPSIQRCQAFRDDISFFLGCEQSLQQRCESLRV